MTRPRHYDSCLWRGIAQPEDSTLPESHPTPSSNTTIPLPSPSHLPPSSPSATTHSPHTAPATPLADSLPPPDTPHTTPSSPRGIPLPTIHPKLCGASSLPAHAPALPSSATSPSTPAPAPDRTAPPTPSGSLPPLALLALLPPTRSHLPSPAQSAPAPQSPAPVPRLSLQNASADSHAFPQSYSGHAPATPDPVLPSAAAPPERCIRCSPLPPADPQTTTAPAHTTSAAAPASMAL